jgi:hypothetical protein
MTELGTGYRLVVAEVEMGARNVAAEEGKGGKGRMSYVVGIAWFKDEITYRRALTVFKDPQDMPTRFEEWKAIVEKQCELVKAGGNIVLRVDVDPDKFVAWCAVQGFEPNAWGRTAFVNRMELEYQKTGQGTIME